MHKCRWYNVCGVQPRWRFIFDRRRLFPSKLIILLTIPDVLKWLIYSNRIFQTGMYVYIFIWSNVNIWNANFARATAFINDTRTDVLVKLSKFLRQKMSRSEGDLNWGPNHRIHAECPNHLIYQGQTFAVPCFFNTGSGDIDNLK